MNYEGRSLLIIDVIYALLISIPSSTRCTVVGFRHQGLLSVPTGIDPGTTTLRLSYNAITRIEQHSLQGLSQLTKLIARYNEIYFLDDMCFTWCPSLEVINFNYNRLNIFPNLGRLMSLVYIGARESNMYIPADYFYDHDHLKYLIFSNGGLNNIPRFSAKSQLEGLFMSGNPIVTVPDLSQMSNLAALEIETDSLLCDMRMCWLLFEPFDPTTRPPVISPATGNSSPPINALDLETLSCNNMPYNGTLLRDINPVQLKCYDSK